MTETNREIILKRYFGYKAKIDKEYQIPINEENMMGQSSQGLKDVKALYTVTDHSETSRFIDKNFQPLFQMNHKLQENDVVQTLNLLYRTFQEEFVENPDKGRVGVVSNSHIICNGRKGKRVVTLPELYVIDKPEVSDIRVFTNLLPNCATFYIIHHPDSYDIFEIEWKDGPLKPYQEIGPSSTGKRTQKSSSSSSFTS